VDRIDHQDVGEGFYHIPQGPADVFKAGAEIFPAMTRDQDQAVS
jgi:hypothetical protein